MDGTETKNIHPNTLVDRDVVHRTIVGTVKGCRGRSSAGRVWKLMRWREKCGGKLNRKKSSLAESRGMV